jgi:hypothetical protein
MEYLILAVSTAFLASVVVLVLIAYRQECRMNRAIVERLDPHRQYATSVIVGRRTIPAAVQSEV